MSESPGFASAPGFYARRILALTSNYRFLKVSLGRPGVALAIALCLVASLQAHRMPGSISTVKPSANGTTVEIIHRLHAHDAELGLNTVLDERRVSVESLRGQAQLALYVEERFSLAPMVDGERGSRLPLELIGAELEGEFVLIYQEFAGTLPASLAIRDDILRDVFPGQINHVNVATGDEVHSVTFSDDDEWRTLDSGQESSKTPN